MNAMQLSMALLAALASMVIGALAGRWWVGRRVPELRARIDKLEHARSQAVQHAAQMRRQIEQLQKGLAAQHRARAEARSARKRELSDSLDAATERSALPAHGFADTQPMQ